MFSLLTSCALRIQTRHCLHEHCISVCVCVCVCLHLSNTNLFINSEGLPYGVNLEEQSSPSS